ncbi:beta-aspartyl-peptidase [Vibrio sp. SM6]|uniref:Isoaspartyl dipeptidase n=1 Tax=Vibrio agarilyticus TaxID=2726741 RepID=A0A7X8TTB4_9VIBR|nr:beta-aspartyl-peptidase [Vibrio agarilyticus]NLS14415.1 beta-aspartyl-peptidase [Vibrio agarilyticus]
MLRIIKNVQVFTPEPHSLCDVVITDKRVHSLKPINSTHPPYADIYDGKGAYLVPGFIDVLTHIVGGGGEGGFGNRTLEITAQEMLRAGVTTAVGALGTDAVTRSLANLLGKSRELQAKGISCYFYSGSYHLPLRTLTPSLEEDLIYIPEILGVGELALSDHRGSVVHFDDLLHIGRTVRTSANLAGKKGIVFCHLGDGKEELSLLTQIIEQTEITAEYFLPTHINRNPNLFQTGLNFALDGGYIDFTTSTNAGLIEDGEVPSPQALQRALNAGVHINHITFSSDANASLPRFSASGEVIGVDSGRISSLFEAVRNAVLSCDIPLEIALRCITSNPAARLGLPHKGHIEYGFDADFVLLDPNSLEIQQVWSQGIARI